MSPINPQGEIGTIGFWGKPTSTLDWCERNYEVSQVILSTNLIYQNDYQEISHLFERENSNFTKGWQSRNSIFCPKLKKISEKTLL